MGVTNYLLSGMILQVVNVTLLHPRKINIEPANDGLGDDFFSPSSRGPVVSGSMLIFRGVY